MVAEGENHVRLLAKPNIHTELGLSFQKIERILSSRVRGWLLIILETHMSRFDMIRR